VASPDRFSEPEVLPELRGTLRVASLGVEAGGELVIAQRSSLAEYGVSGVLRQSALDWLEQRRRFSPQGELRVDIRIRVLHLRGSLAARWWPEWVAPDRLVVGVVVKREGVDLVRFERSVESRLGGSDWADTRARARRLARRLGQRVAEAF